MLTISKDKTWSFPNPTVGNGIGVVSRLGGWVGSGWGVVGALGIRIDMDNLRHQAGIRTKLIIYETTKVKFCKIIIFCKISKFITLGKISITYALYDGILHKF